ncbi:MAG: methionyl-tRNA formyltransferase [Blastocatellia bacterium]
MKVVFMGTPAAAVPSLRALVSAGFVIAGVYTQPDKPAGRGQKATVSPVKAFAKAVGLPVFQPSSLKSDEGFFEFSGLGADVAVVVAYGKILPLRYLKAFPLGAVNVHFSLLPKYRGAAPVNWAIARGEKFTGVTTMLMDEGLDTGPILLSKEVGIGSSETASELTARLAEIGSELIVETLENFGSLKPVPQDDTAATYAPILKKSDGLIDWKMKADEIAARVRAFQPFPTAFTYLEGKKLTVWQAEPSGVNPARTEPGVVISANGGEIIIAAGEKTSVSMKELQLEGRRRMSAKAFLNGFRIQPGIRLG